LVSSNSGETNSSGERKDISWIRALGAKYLLEVCLLRRIQFRLQQHDYSATANTRIECRILDYFANQRKINWFGISELTTDKFSEGFGSTITKRFEECSVFRVGSELSQYIC